MPTLLQGAKLTVQLTSIAVCFGIILGTIAGMARISKAPWRLVAASYIDIIRELPPGADLLIFYGLPSLISRPILLMQQLF